MKILIITGEYFPKNCGVGDYTKALYEHLIAHDDTIDVKVLANLNWHTLKWRSILEKVDSFNADIIHLQFPFGGSRYTMIPQLIYLLRKRVIVTFHEFSHLNILKRISMTVFSFNSRLIFTTDFEREIFNKYFFWCKNQNPFPVIPIGSAIEKLQASGRKRDYSKIVYFGQIRPKKGIEQVIELARLIQKHQLLIQVVIAGQIIESQKEYFNGLQRQAAKLPVYWTTNRPQAEIQELLSEVGLSYLPFLDGVSERRSSLLAILNHNMLTFSTIGKQSSQELLDCINTTNSPVDVVTFLQNNTVAQMETARLQKIPYMEALLKKMNYNEIALEHLKVYRAIFK